MTVSSMFQWEKKPNSFAINSPLESIISYPDLLLTKLKAISGQVRKFNYFDWLDCERMTRVLSPVRAIGIGNHMISSAIWNK